MELPVPTIKTVLGSQYATAISQIIEGAKESIFIAMFDWRWYAQDPSNPIQLLNQALVRAVRRGVKVRAITSSPAVVETLNSVGIIAKKINRSGLMHSKVIIVDRRIYSIGSHNLTNSAQHVNVESSVIITDELSAQAHIDYFENLWLL